MAEKTVSTDSLAKEKKQEYTGKKLRVAFIGCGGIAQVQLGAFEKFPDVEVVAAVDIDPERLAVMKETWGVEKTYKDWKTMLKEVKPDAVSICTPNGLHSQPAIDASNAGCHVITEKPMAMNPKECQKMIDAAKKAGKKLVAGFQFRYHPNTEFLARCATRGRSATSCSSNARPCAGGAFPTGGCSGKRNCRAAGR